jgi:hypothetical protein
VNGIDSLAQSIMYVCALIADQPRAIDRYIDYFGEARPAAAWRGATPACPRDSGPQRVTDGRRQASEKHERHERLGDGQRVARAVGSSGSVPRLRDMLRGRQCYLPRLRQPDVGLRGPISRQEA